MRATNRNDGKRKLTACVIDETGVPLRTVLSLQIVRREKSLKNVHPFCIKFAKCQPTNIVAKCPPISQKMMLRFRQKNRSKMSISPEIQQRKISEKYRQLSELD